MNVTDAQWYTLQGQLQALKAGLFALIEAHPNRAVIVTSLQNAQLSAEAGSLPTPVPDEFVTAMQHMLDEFVTVATAPPISGADPRQ